MERRILWTDDHVGKYSAIIGALTARGISVDTAQTGAEALSCVRQRSYNAILVDMRMPQMRGDQLLAELHRIAPEAKYAAVTSFRSDYVDKIARLSFRVPIVEKPLDSVGQPESQAFIARLEEICDGTMARRIPFVERRLGDVSTDPFSISYQSFRSLAETERQALLRVAYAESKVMIQSAFNQGALWVLLSGSPATVVARALSPEEMWDDEQVSVYAAAHDRAAYAFTAPMEVDDIWSQQCNRIDGLSGYPTVSLLIGTGGHPYDVHFDTGAPMTYFRYESLLQAAAIRRGEWLALGNANGKEYMAYTFKIDAILRDQRDGHTANVRVTGQAVVDWPNCPFRRRCKKDDCKWHPPQEDGICKFRNALVGRNLLHENKLSLLLDGSTGTTRLII